MANLKDTLVLGKLTATDSIIAKKFITDGSNKILLANGGLLDQSTFVTSATYDESTSALTTIANNYVSKNASNTLTQANTFEGVVTISNTTSATDTYIGATSNKEKDGCPGALIVNGATVLQGPLIAAGGIHLDDTTQANTEMPYFLGIEAFTQGGAVKWVSKENAKVGYATSAGSATSATTADTATKVAGSYTSNGGQQNPNYFGKNKVGFLMMNTSVNGNAQYKDWLIMDCYSGNDVGGGVAFGVNRQSLGAYIMRSASERTSWSETAELALLSTGNSTANYIPKFTSKNTIGNSNITDNNTSITMGKPVVFANNSWNTVGDDAYFGDQNVAGAFCIRGVNGTTTLRMVGYNNQNKAASFQYNTGDNCIDIVFN